MLRSWFESDEHQGAALASHLIEQILETGLEPTEPPPLLPPTNQDKIELLCWMGIEIEGEYKKLDIALERNL